MALRVGILGAGYIGSLHAQVLATDSRVQLRAVGDALPRMLEAGVDAIYVCVPNVQHAATAMQALHAGVHLFLEKPFATTLDDAQALLETARAAPGQCQVGHSRRFAPVYQVVRQALD